MFVEQTFSSGFTNFGVKDFSTAIQHRKAKDQQIVAVITHHYGSIDRFH
jgi:hypothetical protein